MLYNVNAQCDVNIAMYGNGNKNVITEKKKKKKGHANNFLEKLTVSRQSRDPVAKSASSF